MFGEKRELMTMTCVACKKQVAMRVDPEDVQKHVEGMFVQHAFADRDGKPYLDPAERELWISGVCNDCWAALCPPDPASYS